jgi:hypothetical protein
VPQAHSFAHDQVNTQLVQQQITFPVASSPAITALPAANASAMKQYAGQQMTTGDQARTYAENFMAVHLKEIGQGKTYAYWSGLAMSTKPTAKAAVYENTALTLFRGDTLRSLLNEAWAFWFVGTLALYAAIGLSIGAVVVFFAFLYEFLVVPKREGVVELKRVSQQVTAAV